MNRLQVNALKVKLLKLWVVRPERLWLASIALHRRGHWVMAFWLKQLGGLLYANSLSPGAEVSPDVVLGHNSIGIVVTPNCTIGKRVRIWQNVTLSAGRSERPAPAGNGSMPHPGAAPGGEQGPPSRIIIENDVSIGANAVVIAPRGRPLTIGRGASVGAGTVVTEDVPQGATVVGPPARVITREERARRAAEETAEADR